MRYNHCDSCDCRSGGFLALTAVHVIALYRVLLLTSSKRPAHLFPKCKGIVENDKM